MILNKPLVRLTTAHYQSAVSMISFAQVLTAQWSDIIPCWNVQFQVGITSHDIPFQQRGMGLQRPQGDQRKLCAIDTVHPVEECMSGRPPVHWYLLEASHSPTRKAGEYWGDQVVGTSWWTLGCHSGLSAWQQYVYAAMFYHNLNKANFDLRVHLQSGQGLPLW